MNLNIYGSKKVRLPIPELYVIYHGERGNKPDEISLSKDIFGEESADNIFVDVKAKIIFRQYARGHYQPVYYFRPGFRQADSNIRQDPESRGGNPADLQGSGCAENISGRRGGSGDYVYMA